MNGGVVENSRIYEFFKQLDRSFFLDNHLKRLAQYDGPLPIGSGQTISQPTLVYSMTCSLEIQGDSRVLEIGTGSGYQTVFLAEFAREVYTVERIRELAHKAEEKLCALGYDNIVYRTGDGSEGWPDKAPFDRIIVTAAASVVPNTLVAQLAPGGKMIIPVGPRVAQELLLVKKDRKGKTTEKSLGGVRFVEMVGRYGWSD